MRQIVKFFRVTMLWILLLPVIATVIGAASNQAVLIANGDKFPVLMNPSIMAQQNVDSNGMLDNEHCVMTHSTHLNALADIFDTHDAWISVGDILIELGSWLAGFCPFIWLALVVQKLNG
jgi:hypothetical protein